MIFMTEHIYKVLQLHIPYGLNYDIP
jgi:hypothetical protein